MSRQTQPRRRRQLYPKKRWVDESTILDWARDLEADGKIVGGFGDDVDEAIRQMEDLGVATFAEVAQVRAHREGTR